MKLTNRHLAFLGLAIGGIGLAFEWKKLFPAGLSNPLAKRAIGTTPATGRAAVSANANTTGRVSPNGTTTRAAGYGVPSGRSSPGSTLTLGTALTPLAGFLGALLRGSSSSSPKPDTSAKPPGASLGGGGGAPSAPGGSAGRVDAGRGAPFSNDNRSNAGGAGPQDGSTPYGDINGWVAYPQGDGSYQDENGNQVYIREDGTITYDPTQDVGYVAGGEVFPSADADPYDPSTYDFYGDGGSLAAPDPSSPTPGAFDDTGGIPLAPGDETFYGNSGDDTFLAGDGGGTLQASDFYTDSGVSDLGGDFSGASVDDMSGGGGDGFYQADNEEYSDGF